MKKMTFWVMAVLVCHTFACTVPAHSANGGQCQIACSTLPIALNAPDMNHPTYDLSNVHASCIDNTAAIGNVVNASCSDGMTLVLFQDTSDVPVVVRTDTSLLLCTVSGWQVTIEAIGTSAGSAILSPPYQLACVDICTKSCPRHKKVSLVADPAVPNMSLGGTPTISAGEENGMCEDNNKQSAIGDTYIVDCPEPTTQLPILVDMDGTPIAKLPAGTLTLVCGTAGWTSGETVVDGSTSRITCLTCLPNCPAAFPAALLRAVAPMVNAPIITSACLGSIGFFGQTRTIACPASTPNEVINFNEIDFESETGSDPEDIHIGDTLTCIEGGWAGTSTAGLGALQPITIVNSGYQLQCI